MIVGAIAASLQLARRLEPAPGAPVLRIRTTSIDHDGEPPLCSTTDCRADVMDYCVSLRG